MSEKVIDLEEVMERVQDDKELLLELFDIFSADYAVKMKTLKTAISEKDLEVVKDVVHSIKGAAGNISAKVVHAMCMNIEHLAALKDIAVVETAIPVLEENFQALQVRMNEIKKEFSKA